MLCVSGISIWQRRHGLGWSNRGRSGGRHWFMVVLVRLLCFQSKAWKRKRRGEKGDLSSGDIGG